MKITRVGVIGSGPLAQGIAQTVANAKFDVVLFEPNEKAVAVALDEIERSIDHAISRWGLTPGDKKAILKRISPATIPETLAHVQILIDASDNDGMLLSLEHLTSEKAILMSNTNTANISETQKQMKFPERLIGLHFIPLVTQSGIVEVIKGMQTSDGAVRTTRLFIETIGKKPVEVFEYPGFVTSRIILPMINAAAQVYLEGLASAEEIDDAIHLGYNFPLGPLALADHIGIDVVLEQLESIFKNLGEMAYQPCPIFRKMVREGKLGLKSREGFFRYDPSRQRVLVSNP